jgi:hypothetical protein
MDSNTYSNRPVKPPVGPPDGRPDRLASVVAARQELAAQDLDGLSDVALAEDTDRLRRHLDGLEGEWLRRLATLDAHGAAGAELDQPAPSTASWLRDRLRMSAGAARSTVRTARALFRGPLKETAAALVAGELSVAHAKVVADGTQDLPDHIKLDADPILVELATRLDPPQLRRAVAHLGQVADPEGADRARHHRHARRGLWVAPTWDDMVAVDGLLEPEAGAVLLAALAPLARPADAHDDRKGSQRNADALTELARRSLEGGWLPKAGGVRPQLLVTMDLDSLLGRPGAVGGETGWAGPLAPEACRRLACDATLTRVVVSRQSTSGPTCPTTDPEGSSGGHDPDTDRDPAADPGLTDAGGLAAEPSATANPRGEVEGLQERLGAAMAWLPPTLGGAARQPLDVGRATRVVHPAQRAALAVRDGGCVFPGCDRPLAWCDAHHLWHWVDGGPTDLWNLAMVCRAHHRAVHEEGWRLIRGPDGRFTVTPTRRRHQAFA